MAANAATYDKRLIGTWKSDSRRTFRNWKPRAGVSPARTRKFKGLFGKLIVRWTPKGVFSGFDPNALEGTSYEVVASDSFSVVVRTYCEWLDESTLDYILFEDDCYWLTNAMIRFGECFRRIA